MRAVVESLAVPGLTDTKEYGDLYDWALRGGLGLTLAGELREMRRLRDAADLMMVRLARTMRKEGRTWEQVGDALGMTRQGAQRFLQRHGSDL